MNESPMIEKMSTNREKEDGQSLYYFNMKDIIAISPSIRPLDN